LSRDRFQAGDIAQIDLDRLELQRVTYESDVKVRVDPNKLIAYGVSLGQIEQQLANNNVNGGGSFIEAGLQQINVRAVGQVKTVADIERTVIASKNGTAVRIKDVATVEEGAKIRLGQFGKAIHRADGRILDHDDVVAGIVLLRKGANSDSTLDAIHGKVRELNDHILPPGVKVVPHLDRSDLVHLTMHTVMHNLTVGIILVSLILFVFLGNARGALIVTLTIPFSLLFAAICLNLRHVPANLLSLGALDFGMIVEGAIVMIENIVRMLSHRHLERHETVARRIGAAAHEVQRPVFYSIAIIIVAYLPIFTLQAVEGRLFKPMAWTVALALLGGLLFSMLVGPVLASLLLPKGTREWRNPIMGALTRAYARALSVAIDWRWVTVTVAAAALAGTYLLSRTVGSEFLPHLDEGAIMLKAGWLLLFHDGCRFAVRGSWRPDADAGFVSAPNGGSLSVRMFRITSWSAHKAQIRAAFGPLKVLHEDSDRRLWFEIGDKQRTQHYIDVANGLGTCTGLLEIRTTTTSDAGDTAARIADSIGAAPDKWP